MRKNRNVDVKQDDLKALDGTFASAGKLVNRLDKHQKKLISGRY